MITVIIMEETMKYFAEHITYDVPEQDLTVDLNSIPGYVKSTLLLITFVKLLTEHKNIKI